MSSSPNIFADVANKFSLQICLGPSLKDIKITDDDPTAGMSQDQFNSYMNSGVNLCGWPEWLNIGLGFALNSGLLLLGFQFLVLSK